MEETDLLAQLAAKLACKAEIGAVLAEHNSWKIGGRADLLIEPENIAQVAEAVRLVRDSGLPLLVVGQGTNLLFDDAGVRGVVMKLGERFSAIRFDGQDIYAQAGAWVPQLARLAMKQGLAGLEHCIGIPGTLGGLVAMNGGSQRHAIGENIVRVTVVDPQGNIVALSNEQCHFSYRHSALQETGQIVVAAQLYCPQAVVTQVRREMLNDLRTRRTKFPRKEPNCGSVFLSTSEMHATVGPPGKIIEEAGLKGERCGQAQVSHKHANFIVNLGGASSRDVLCLIARIRTLIRERIGFDLCCEVRYVSPACEVMSAHKKADELCD